MEINVKEVREVARPGRATFWSALDVDGVEYTCWDGNIANDLKKLGKFDVELKVTESNGKTYRNIKILNSKGTGNIEVNPTEVRKLNSQKDISITAQCLCKAVIGQTKNFENELITISDAVEMYKAAVLLLEE